MHRKVLIQPLLKDKLGLILMSIVLVVAGIAHGVNMFGFPYFENDEGVYMSQAWSLVTQGEMAPYTYWYDHAPAGWIFIAFWTLLTGGFYTFGFSLNSGRVFMLVLQIASTFLLMLITRKITRNNYAAVIAGLFFALTPIGLYFHRRILLDNIMTFWVLSSYYFIIRDKLKINDVMLSAILFGVAVLTKENAIFFIPGFLVTIAIIAHRYHRNLALIKWVAIVGLLVSVYFLYALLKGELFPTGSLLGGNNEHVSLLETLKYQSSRSGGSFLNPESDFWKYTQLWVLQDPFILILGSISNILVFITGIFSKKRIYIALSLLGFLFWYYLARGGIVIEFYIIPLLPLLALYIGIAISELTGVIKKYLGSVAFGVVVTTLIAMLFSGYVLFSQVSRAFPQENAGHSIYSTAQTEGQLLAIDWIRKNVPTDDLIVIDNYAYIDLKDTRNPSGTVFENAHWYWKIDQDPEIKKTVTKGNPEAIKYIAQTPQMRIDLSLGNSVTTSQALLESKLAKSFGSPGWGVEIFSTRYPSTILRTTWESYKQHFIQSGRVIDPYRDKITTSEGQSYALLRSVWLDDREAFDEILAWTNEYLLNSDGLYAWKYGENEQGINTILDAGSASDADQDIALALLFAHKRWGDQSYLVEAKQVTSAIWQNEVKEMGGRYYLLAGTWGNDKDGILTNPSYMSPFIYRIFQEVDPEHEWISLVDTSYEVLELCSSSDLDVESPVFLAPEWCQITEEGEAIVPTEAGLTSTDYSYNAFRIPWKMALDYKWNDEPRALDYLRRMSFIREEWQNQQKLLVAYTHEGEVADNYESVAAYATNLALFELLDNKQANSIYLDKIKSKLYEDETQTYWEDPGNYYTQNWAWFGTALYTNQLPNLWQEL